MSETHEQMDPALVALWARSRQTINQRFEVVERCVAAWTRGQADAALVASARQETHRLAGSLSIFGFSNGARQARDLEQLLRTEGHLLAKQLELDLGSETPTLVHLGALIADTPVG